MAAAAAAPFGGWLFLALCWVLVLMSLTGASVLPTTYQTNLPECNSDKSQVIRVDLMHRDHPESPLSVPKTTTAERYRAASARQSRRMARRGLTEAAVKLNTSIVSAYAEDSEEYVLTVYLGTPAKKFFLIMDTGSDLVWVQCLPCVECYNETNPYFNPSASSSYSALNCSSSNCNQTLLGGAVGCNSFNTCQIHYAYAQAGSSYRGVLSTETISFNNATESIPNFIFGCMDNNTASFGKVDGFIGFGRRAFSLPNQLSAMASINVFSYCLVPFSVSTTLTSTLVFGVADTNKLQLAYTPLLNIVHFPTFYWVNMTGISINGVALSIPMTSFEYNSSSKSGGVIFDSGTNLFLLRNDIWTTITETLEPLITYPIALKSNTSLCYNVSRVQEFIGPNMTLHFAGLNSTVADFLLSDENMFQYYEENVVCLTISPTRESININIIGNIAQADHYIETDLENMRIGWMSRDCSLPM